MKRALIILIPLIAAVAGAIIAMVSPGSRSTNVRGDWTGHTVPFYLPVDAGLMAITPGAPPPSGRVTLTKDGALYVGATKFPHIEQGGLAGATAKVKEVVASGTKQWDIDAETDVEIVHVIRVMSMLLAEGAERPGLAAGPDDPAAPLGNGGGPIAGFTPPAAPQAPSIRSHTIAANQVVIIYLDGVQKRTVLRMHGHPDEAVTAKRLEARMKKLAGAHRNKERPQLADCLVLIHAGPDTTWAMFSAALTECAKAGIWRIEVPVDPGDE
ncbi:MAG: hypothetical protein ACYTGX_16990 [Planctomycetota bacterium]|jgi:biopolymer transport protein ExbD